MQPAGGLSCSLVTPNAENVSFSVASSAGGSGTVVLAPAEGSVWPAAPAAGSRDGNEIAIGGRGGLILNVGPPLALLSRSDSRGAIVPVAVGACREAVDVTVSAVSGSVSNDLPAFDPAQWPRHCGLLLSDGRRVRFRYQTGGPRGPAQMLGEGLWGNQPVTTRFAGVTSGTSHFGDRTGPAGTDRMLGSGDARAKIIAFTRIGDPSISAQTGVGICGYNNITRRPNIR